MGSCPRSCGGSSPLARGLLRGEPLAGLAAGIIPARAGFTARQWVEGIYVRDHPRSRGVYEHPPSLLLRRHGSSPLARGLREHGGHGLDLVGIIPARAGFTETLNCPVNSPSDHPRSRGVYSSSISASHSAAGSSPLARGLCDRGPLRVLRRRRTGARGAEDWKFSLRYGILVPRSSARKEQPWVLLSRP